MNPLSWIRWRLAQLGALTATFRYAWRRTWCLGLGDYAETLGRGLLLVQGTCAPTWECKDLATGERLRVHERDMRKTRTAANYLGSFRSGWRWFYGYWFHIEVGRRLGQPGAYYGTDGAMRRRQRRFDKRYVRDANRRAAQSST